MDKRPFNSRPHKEVDSTGLNTSMCRILSIHDLTRRSTMIQPCSKKLFVFQFTTSQGGRPFHLVAKAPALSFNSRPHKEVDLLRRNRERMVRSFNSRPHKEVDRATCRAVHTRLDFQFTTSQGGRLVPSFLVIFPTFFQFTTSQGGRRQLAQTLLCHNPFNSRPHKEVDHILR